jgi:hypothetical protein
MNIKELTADEEIQSSWEIMKELRADLVESEFIEFVKAMRREGYRLFGLFKDNTLVSVVGFAILINLYYKRHVWIYDLVTKESERSRGRWRRRGAFRHPRRQHGGRETNRRMRLLPVFANDAQGRRRGRAQARISRNQRGYSRIVFFHASPN